MCLQPARGIMALAIACMSSMAAAQAVVLSGEDLVPTALPQVFLVPNANLPDAPQPTGPVGPSPEVAGGQLLAGLVAKGQSQGFDGIYYENRDRGHSTLPESLFPGLAYLRYDAGLLAEQADYGLASRIVIEAPLIGNSSTALTRGPFARSQSRLAMTSELGAEVSYQHYASDSLYIYPEHRDHDGQDFYPANWPYTVNSQGSSGSDRPFLEALLMTLAAFPADTRAKLIETHQIAPTLQMIMRRNLRGVDSDKGYMAGIAHPSAFEGTDLRPERMIAHAAAMRPDTIPPVIRLRVDSEEFESQTGLTRQSELLFTTPSAIARLWRSGAWSREMVVSATGSVDANGRPLTFHWVILRGDPERVRIEPLDSDGTRARVRINWHDEYPAPWAKANVSLRRTSRVDIGVFADNGVAISAPAFVSVAFPTHQLRRYAPGEDGAMRLVSIDYDAASRSAVFDPRLFWTGPWTDEIRYDAEGRPDGWDRMSEGRPVSRFLADGTLADGREVRYVRPNPALPMLLEWRPDPD